MTPNIERAAGVGGLETWTLRDGAGEAHVIPERGALVTRWRVGDVDVLFLDEATLADRTKNVRGGIPLLFPNPGPLPNDGVDIDGRRVKQPQHGFSRKQKWTVRDAVSDGDMARLSLELKANAETREGFPFDVDQTFDVSLVDGRLLLEWSFTNRGDVPAPLHVGLHPYFTVPLSMKPSARVPTTSTRLRHKVRGDGPVTPLALATEEVDVALLKHGPAATLFRGDGSRVELNSTPQLSTLVVWTLVDQPFICVEPWTAPGGTLAAAPKLAAGAIERMACELRFYAAR